MLSALYRSTLVTLLLAFILCGLYPLAVTGVAKVFFPKKSGGEILFKNGKAVGARLIGQNFSDPKYFHGRPSSAGEGYDASSSSGSNLGPTSQKLIDGLNANLKKVLEENPGIQTNQIPVDLVTASGSGLDPHLSPEAAYLQAERIAKVRSIPIDQVKKIIQIKTEGPQWGLFGESVVNVFEINLALDEIRAKR